MSVFKKAWHVLRDARRAVAVVADVGAAVKGILGIRSAVLDKVIDAASRLDKAASEVEDAAGKKKA